MSVDMSNKESVELRLEKRVLMTETCWLWIGKKHPNGYGVIRDGNGSEILTHRLSYILFHGNIPKGFSVLHKCDVRNCINPSHLFTGTQIENMKDMYKKKRHCFGERHYNCKLSYSDVKLIRKLCKHTSQYKLAKRFNVTGGHISDIANMKKRIYA